MVQLPEPAVALAMLEATADATCDVDLVAGTATLRARGGALFGYAVEPTPVSTAWWRERIHPEDATRVIAGLEAALERPDAGFWRDEYRWRRQDGTYAHIADRRTIVRDDRGRARRMVGGLIDESERRELDERLRLAQRLESLGTLTGGIAHDLNNILTPLMLAVSLLREAVTDPDLREIVDTIDDSTRRGASLVSQVLLFSRGSEGRPRLVDAGEALGNVAALIRDTFPRQIILELRRPDGDASLIIDPAQLQQVLLNLVVNARDAMPTGGRLRLSTEVVTLDEHYVAMLAEGTAGRYVLFTVADEGVGIGRAVRERIFDPFFTTKAVGSGTGLGLATVLAIVRAHRGFIHVDSEPGQGSTFRVFLPHAAADPGGDADSAPPTNDGHDELVLIVDDELAVRTLMARALRAHRYRVLTAADGAEALTLFAQHTDEIAVVVTDMVMPIMGGRATIHALRRLRRDVPIIATSGQRGETRLRAEESDATAFLLKPYTAETLLECLRQVIAAARPRHH